MDEIDSYAQTCQDHLDLRQEKLSLSLTNVNTFWEYLDMLEPDYHILLADTFVLVGAYMVSGISAFRDLDPKFENPGSYLLSELVAKYTVDDKNESFAIGICNLVSRHPVAIAYHLKWEYKLEAFGTLNGLSECLAFPGGWKLIPKSEEWLPLTVLWHMWRHSLRSVRIPPNTAEYLYQEYYVADRFDPNVVMYFLDVKAPEPNQVISTLDRLIKEFISPVSFAEGQNALLYLNEMYPQCHRCITDFYSTYKKRKSFPRATYVENENIIFEVTKLRKGSDQLRIILSDRGILSIGRDFSMEALFWEEPNSNPLQISSRLLCTRTTPMPSNVQKELKYEQYADVQIPTTRGLSDERSSIYARFPNYGSFSVQTETEKGSAYQTRNKIRENPYTSRHRSMCGRPRTKSCDSEEVTNLQIRLDNLNVSQTPSARNANLLLLNPEIEQSHTGSGEMGALTMLQTTNMSPEKYKVARGQRLGKGDRRKLGSSQKFPDLNTFQQQTTKNVNKSFPATPPVIQTLPSLLQNVRIGTSDPRETQKKRDWKKGLTRFQYKSRTSEQSSEGRGRGLPIKSNIPQKLPSVPASHIFAQAMPLLVDNPPKSPDQFEECRTPQDKKSDDSSPSKRQ